MNKLKFITYLFILSVLLTAVTAGKDDKKSSKENKLSKSAKNKGSNSNKASSSQNKGSSNNKASGDNKEEELSEDDRRWIKNAVDNRDEEISPEDYDDGIHIWRRKGTNPHKIAKIYKKLLKQKRVKKNKLRIRQSKYCRKQRERFGDRFEKFQPEKNQKEYEKKLEKLVDSVKEEGYTKYRELYPEASVECTAFNYCLRFRARRIWAIAEYIKQDPEATSEFKNLRWFLKEKGVGDSKMKKICFALGGKLVWQFWKENQCYDNFESRLTDFAEHYSRSKLSWGRRNLAEGSEGWNLNDQMARHFYNQVRTCVEEDCVRNFVEVFQPDVIDENYKCYQKLNFNLGYFNYFRKNQYEEINKVRSVGFYALANFNYGNWGEIIGACGNLGCVIDPDANGNGDGDGDGNGDGNGNGGGNGENPGDTDGDGGDGVTDGDPLTQEDCFADYGVNHVLKIILDNPFDPTSGELNCVECGSTEIATSTGSDQETGAEIYECLPLVCGEHQNIVPTTIETHVPTCEQITCDELTHIYKQDSSGNWFCEGIAQCGDFQNYDSSTNTCNTVECPGKFRTQDSTGNWICEDIAVCSSGQNYNQNTNKCDSVTCQSTEYLTQDSNSLWICLPIPQCGEHQNFDLTIHECVTITCQEGEYISQRQTGEWFCQTVPTCPNYQNFNTETEQCTEITCSVTQIFEQDSTGIWFCQNCPSFQNADRSNNQCSTPVCLATQIYAQDNTGLWICQDCSTHENADRSTNQCTLVTCSNQKIVQDQSTGLWGCQSCGLHENYIASSNECSLVSCPDSTFELILIGEVWSCRCPTGTVQSSGTCTSGAVCEFRVEDGFITSLNKVDCICPGGTTKELKAGFGGTSNYYCSCGTNQFYGIEGCQCKGVYLKDGSGACTIIPTSFINVYNENPSTSRIIHKQWGYFQYDDIYEFCYSDIIKETYLYNKFTINSYNGAYDLEKNKLCQCQNGYTNKITNREGKQYEFCSCNQIDNTLDPNTVIQCPGGGLDGTGYDPFINESTE